MKYELLAPAGDPECFEAAINAGADAVYAGAERFSARAYAGNLTSDDLISGIRKAHLHNVSVYLTLNTLINTNEYEEAYDLVRPLYESGLDGIIVQDLGLISMLRDSFPGLKLHASTQMSIMNSYGALLMRDQGFTRIVPARELTLPEISHIKEESGLEIECFIHGAMCYSYSGLCLMSSMIGGRSGNRGRCAGTCRLPFDVLCDGKPVDADRGRGESYPLSMKDMCTLDILPQLMDAGIDSFKIEGRMKSPEYVAGVTAMYRKYMDMYLEHPGKYRISEEDRRHLNSLYIRTDISSGYYTGTKGKDLITLDSPGYNGNDEDHVRYLHDKYVHDCDRPDAGISAYIHAGERAVFTAACGYTTVSVTGDMAENAQKAPLKEDDVRSRLMRSGESGFNVTETDIDLGQGSFMTVSSINGLRRQVLGELADRVIEDNGYASHRNAGPFTGISHTHTEDHSSHTTLDVLVTTRSQLDAVMSVMSSGAAFGRLYIDYGLVPVLNSDTRVYESVKSGIPEIFLSLPSVMRDRIIRGRGYDDHGEAHRLYDEIGQTVNDTSFIKGILVHNIDELGFAIDRFPDKDIVTDAHVYAHNPYAAAYLESLPNVKGYTCPYELNRKGLFESQTDAESTLIVYGYIPMMISAGCVYRTYDRCRYDRTTDAFSDTDASYMMLRDRKGMLFPVVTDCRICANKIYNERPLCLYDTVKKETDSDGRHISDRYRIDLTIEDHDDSLKILTGFVRMDRESDELFAGMPTTTGHMKRGAM